MRLRALLFASLFAAVGCADEPPPSLATLGEADAPIVGGSVDQGHHYTVGVGDDFQAWCSATLISKQTVLTAAHCALGITQVYFGPNLSSSAAVDTESIHPQYVDGNFDTPDLAVVRLAQPTTLQPAPLLRDTLENTPEFIGPLWTWSGYGVDDPVSGTGFGIRRVTTIAVKAIGPTTTIDGFPINELFLYYETSGSSPCFGDSGGPAYFVAQGTEHVAGVASWVGDDFCSTYGAHARADQPTITSWLQGKIDQFEPGNTCKNDGVCDESCNTGGEVLDPDCHSAHCAADGICALACVAPVDPDCSGMSFCGPDGVCDPDCPQPDPDCGTTSTVATTTATSTVASTTTAATTVAATTTTGPTSTVTTGATMTTGSGGAGGGPSRAPTSTADDSALLYGRGCAHGGSGDGRAPWLIALGLMAAVARRRRER
jgi:MYXO-CTERM domain-containing protein